MDWSNPYLLIALAGALVLYHIELIADFLNLSQLKPRPSEPCGQALTDEEHERMSEYQVAGTKADIVQRSLSLGMLIGFWFCGGFQWLDEWSRSFGLHAVQTGVVVIAVLALAQSILSLPFEIWDTFGIEAKFGFNKTTAGTFIADRIKSLVLMAAIGLPLAWLVIWLFETQELAAAYAFICVAVFSIVMSWLAPRLIMPLFLKFTPLESASLRERILSMAGRLAFPVADVSVADGSRRSTKANAFFAGFGKTKRIALFDTLLASHTEDEILAVLAHEIGHFKRRHVLWQMAAGLLAMAVLFGLLHVSLRDPRLFAAFGVREMSAGMGLVLFSIVYQPLSEALSLLSLFLSRRFEFEADAFASAAMSGPRPLMDALGKLSRDHLSHPHPHPLFVMLNCSHPPAGERLRALAGG